MGSNRLAKEVQREEILGIQMVMGGSRMGETWGPTRWGMWRGEVWVWVGQHETGAEQMAGVGVHTWTRGAEAGFRQEWKA